MNDRLFDHSLAVHETYLNHDHGRIQIHEAGPDDLLLTNEQLTGHSGPVCEAERNRTSAGS